jgi:hypothetical protein
MKRSKNETKKKNGILIQKLLWFKEHVADKTKSLNNDEIDTLISQYDSNLIVKLQLLSI